MAIPFLDRRHDDYLNSELKLIWLNLNSVVRHFKMLTDNNAVILHLIHIHFAEAYCRARITYF